MEYFIRDDDFIKKPDQGKSVTENQNEINPMTISKEKRGARYLRTKKNKRTKRRLLHLLRSGYWTLQVYIFLQFM